MRSFGFRRRGRAVRERVLEGSWIIPTDCGPVEYGTLGEGPSVLVLHGAGARSDPGIAPARGLSLEGFRLIAPSRFGCLGTPFHPDAPPWTEADTWAGLLDALRIRRVAVVAFSGGAAPAAQLALRHPDRVSAMVFMASGAGGLSAQPPVDFCRLDWPLWVLMRAAPRTGYSLVGVPASLISSLPPHERAKLEETITNLQVPPGRVMTRTLLISADDALYRTLPVARQADGPIPHAGPTAWERRQHIPLGRGPEVWPAVAEFIRRATD